MWSIIFQQGKNISQLKYKIQFHYLIKEANNKIELTIFTSSILEKLLIKTLTDTMDGPCESV